MPKRSDSESDERLQWDGKPLDPDFECPDAGVYMIRSKKSGGFYIGASVQLTMRLNGHRTAINSGRLSESQPLLRKGFSKHTEKDVEFRILERLIPFNSQCESDARKLKAMEADFIHRLQPQFNKHKKTKTTFSSHLMPHGIPEDLKPVVA